MDSISIGTNVDTPDTTDVNESASGVGNVPNVLENSSSSTTDAIPASAPNGIWEKLGEVAGNVSNGTFAPPPKGFWGKLGEVLTGGNVTKDMTPSTPQISRNRLDGTIGKGDQDKDLLDKEYSLREGPRDDETPLEKI
ncbi:hypothetical protein H0H93_011052 [Arthromyces matolae]|nr:hypothetical protein H0H93_011052 [Arthromyces matolae]